MLKDSLKQKMFLFQLDLSMTYYTAGKRKRTEELEC